MKSYVWQLPVRLIHWSLAGAIIFNSFFSEEGDAPHEWVGYAAVAFVFLRILWSFWGNQHTRLKNKWQENAPAALVAYLIWTVVLLLGISGWMMGLDTFWGDEWLENSHEILGKILLVLIVFHLLGLLREWIIYRRKTFLSMFTGYRDDYRP